MRLVVAGNFMMPEQPIHRLARTSRLRDRVRFVGLLVGSDKLAAYVDADVVAYPAVDEIFGLVPFESLMCGTPAVVCDDSGCGEWVARRVAGCWSRTAMPTRWRARCAGCSTIRSLRRDCVTNGRRYVEEHLGWDRIAEQTLALYRRVLGVEGDTMTRAPDQVVLLILTWNRRDDVLRCVASLSRLTYPNYLPVVIDNASADGTVAALRGGYPHLDDHPERAQPGLRRRQQRRHPLGAGARCGLRPAHQQRHRGHAGHADGAGARRRD